MSQKKKKSSTKKKSSAKKGHAKVSQVRVQKPTLDDESALLALDDETGFDDTAEAKKSEPQPVRKLAETRQPESAVTEAVPAAAIVAEVSSLGRAATLMPVEEDIKAILKQRAAALASEEVDDGDIDIHLNYIRFRLGDSATYGLPYANLVEVRYATQITPIPCTPAFVAGVFNRQGHLLTVVDLAEYLGVQSEDITETARILIVQHADMTVGLLVSAVEETDQYLPDKLAAALPSSGNVATDYVAGIWNGTVAILDIDEMLSDTALTIDETVA